jgi:hypothetical protein
MSCQSCLITEWSWYFQNTICNVYYVVKCNFSILQFDCCELPMNLKWSLYCLQQSLKWKKMGHSNVQVHLNNNDNYIVTTLKLHWNYIAIMLKSQLYYGNLFKDMQCIWTLKLVTIHWNLNKEILTHWVILKGENKNIKAVRGYPNICSENLRVTKFPLCKEKLQIFTTLNYWLPVDTLSLRVQYVVMCWAWPGFIRKTTDSLFWLLQLDWSFSDN